MGRPIGQNLTKTECAALRFVIQERWVTIEEFAKRELGEDRQRVSRALNGHRVDAEFCERLRDIYRQEVAKNPDLLSDVERFMKHEDRSRRAFNNKLEEYTELVRNAGWSEESARKIARAVLTKSKRLLSVLA